MNMGDEEGCVWEQDSRIEVVTLVSMEICEPLRARSGRHVLGFARSGIWVVYDARPGTE